MTYLVTFVTLDGNIQQVCIDANTERIALNNFDFCYEYDTIVSCKIIDHVI